MSEHTETKTEIINNSEDAVKKGEEKKEGNANEANVNETSNSTTNQTRNNSTNNGNKIEEKQEEDIFTQSYMKKWLIKLSKIFGIRAIIVLIKSKNLLMKLRFKDFFAELFGLSNMRTVAAISLLPILFRLFNKLFDRFEVIKHSKLKKPLSMFLASFICILMEEKTPLVTYIVLAIIIRVFHNLISLVCKKYNVFQEESKLNNYFFFTLSSVFWFSSIFLNPGFEAVVKMSDRYSNFTPNEIPEMKRIREITRLV